MVIKLILWVCLFSEENFFLDNGKFDISVFQKEVNKYMYIPATSGHQKHTINNFILGELRRYVRFNTLEKILKNKMEIFHQTAK